MGLPFTRICGSDCRLLPRNSHNGARATDLRDRSPIKTSNNALMNDLTQKRCVPCEGQVSPATDAEIAQLQQQVPNWDVIEVDGEKRIQRVFTFPNFQAALDFTNRVGEIAEADGHHPALLTEWGKVTVTWWTHAIRGLHENDFIMAAKTNAIAQ